MRLMCSLSLIAESTPRQRTDVVCEIPSLVPSQATTLSIVSGYGQEDLPGTRLQSPFVVEVRDQYGKPFSGAKVVFGVTNNGGGSLSSTMATTNSFGQAQTTLTLGRSAGANWVEARVAGISPSQTFTATAIAPNEPRKATTLSIVSGNNQSGESGMSLGQAFIVGVKDQSAKPLSGIRVTFRITAGRGQLSTQQVDTDSFGLARTTLTLGLVFYPVSNGLFSYHSSSAMRCPCRRLPSKRLYIGYPTMPKALTLENTQLNLCYVQPTPMHRGMMQFQTIPQL